MSKDLGGNIGCRDKTSFLLFHCCIGKGAKTKLHQEYPHRKKRIPPLSRKLVFFADTQKNMQLLDKIHTVFTAALTDRASTIPSNIRGCQSGTWSQRGTKVNGSHHGDNPLLRPTGIQIATKSYPTLQAMAPTNNKTVYQTSFTPYREQPRSTRVVVAYPRPAFSATNRTNTFQPVLIDNSKFLKATHRTKIKKIEIPRSMVVEALSW